MNECFRRVYGCNFSQKSRFTKKLKRAIDRNVEKKPKFDMNEDVGNLILMAVDNLDLPPYTADRAKFIMANMWSHPDNFHDIKYENVILGTLMFVVYEDLRESVTVDFNSYCTYLFGTARAERNIRQMYQAYLIICDLYKETEQEHVREQRKRVLEKRKRILKIRKKRRKFRCRGNKYIYYIAQQVFLI